MDPLDVDIDGIIENLGNVGKYQIRQLLWTLIPVVLCGLHTSNYIFVAPDVTYRCLIPECNDTAYDASWLSSAIPRDDKCSRYAPVSGNLTRRRNPKDDTVCSAELFDKNKTVPCEQYMFLEDNTFIEEVNIPCESWKRTLIGTVYCLGTLLALPIIGTFSDRFGRRHALVVSSLLEGFLGMIKGLSINYAMFLAMDLIEPTFGTGIYTSAYILALELLTPSTRVAAGALINIYFAIGQILMGLFAWVFPYWRTFLLVTYAPSLLLFVFYWISDESIRWLISRHRYQEAVEVLSKVAKENKKTLPEKAMESLRFNIKHAASTDVDTLNGKMGRVLEKTPSPLSLVFRSKILILRVLKVSVWWVTCTFCFYGLSINSTVLKGNMYVNFIVSAVVEIPAHIVGYFSLTYFGRKKTIFSSFLFAGFSLLSFAFIPEGMTWLSQVGYFLGKFFVTLAFGSVYLYTSELFPTQQRHFLLAMCSLIGRLGSMLAPQTPLLAEYLAELPSCMFAGTCLISAALMLTSPETLNLKLPETIEEAESISRRSRSLLDTEILKLAHASGVKA